MRRLLLAFLASVAGLLAWAAPERPRTRAGVRRSSCESAESPQPAHPCPAAATDETEPSPPTDESEALPPVEEDLLFSWGSPTRVRVVSRTTDRPVPGARAWVAHYDGDRWDARGSVTDGGGDVMLPRGWEDVYRLLVRKRGYVTHSAWVGRYEDPPTQVRLVPGLPLRGRVILDSGAPVTGARVYAWDAGTREEIALRLEHLLYWGDEYILTDEEGRFEIDGVAGEFILAVDALHYGVYRAHHRPVPELLVTLGRGGVLEGCVRDDQGRLVPTADVYVEPAREDGTCCFGIISGERPNARTETAPDGHYRITGLAPGRYVVTASKDYWARGASSPVDLADGARAYRCVTLERAAALRVRIEGRSGCRPWCRLRKPDGSSSWSRFWSNSSIIDDGRYERDGIHAGTYDLYIPAGPGRPKIVRRIELRPGETLDVTVRLP